MITKNTTLLRNGLFLELQFIISLISTKKQNAEFGIIISEQTVRRKSVLPEKNRTLTKLIG